MTEAEGQPAQRAPAGTPSDKQANPWNALWAMLVGFFMILVDSTIVAVANPNIMESLGADYDAVIWVTSAYLLAYAVPLLVAGRLGDQFGPKNLYLAGLGVFTLASLWCGLSGSIEMLIVARVAQGIGAALLTPQTLSTITRIFPPQRRGVAMSVWGATAGVATLVGPLAGGVLVDTLGWQWIFIVNVPIGVIGLALAVWLIPVLPTTSHHFDLLGVALSGVGMFLIVFGLQEGQSHGWAWWIWGLLVAGIAAFALFVYWQAVNKKEPLIPLRIFRDRDFSLANAGGVVIGFVITAFIVPVMFFAQAVCGLSPTQSALLTAPMAVMTGVLAPFVGRLVDRIHPRPIVGFGFSMAAIALTWLSIEMTPTTPIWRLVLPLTAFGVATAFIFAPLAATATRHLPPDVAGAASGVYNATRQVGSVLGSAAIAAFMTSRISAEMPGGGQSSAGEGAVTDLPSFLLEPFASALSQSLLLPAFIALFGVIAALFLLGFNPAGKISARATERGLREARTEVIPVVNDRPGGGGSRRRSVPHLFTHDDYDTDYDDDFADDAYVDVEVGWEPEPHLADHADHAGHVDHVDEPATDVLPAPVGPARREATEPELHQQPIGFAHNGFHVTDPPRDGREYQPPRAERPRSQDGFADGFDRLASEIDAMSAGFTDFFGTRRLPEAGDAGSESADHSDDSVDVEDSQSPPSRHALSDNTPRPPRHYREDVDEAAGHGRHSRPIRDQTL